MFLNILQNSQENTCLRPSLEILLKREFNADVFLWISKNFKNTCFYRTPPVAVSTSRDATHNVNLLRMFGLGENFSQGILVCILLALFSVDNNVIENLWKRKFTNLMSMHLFRQQCFYNIYKLVFFINPSLINTRRYISQDRKFLKFSEFWNFFL